MIPMWVDHFFNNPWNGIVVGIIALIFCWGPKNVWEAFHNSKEEVEKNP